MDFLRRATANGRRPAWAVKLDVASFFPTIHKQTLYEMIAAHVRHPELLWLTRTLLFHDPTMNYRFRALVPEAPGPGSDRYPVPAIKSLFGKGNERGLPIGNLTSQFWGSDQTHSSAASRAGQHVDIERPPHQIRPRPVTSVRRRGRLVTRIGGRARGHRRLNRRRAVGDHARSLAGMGSRHILLRDRKKSPFTIGGTHFTARVPA